VTTRTGAAGRLAAAFIHSKLTPLVILASLLLGVYAVLALPREEEPQIVVPMIDVFVTMPGASPAEVEQRVTRPLEKLLWEIPGVEYLYSTSSPGRAMVVVRFLVGEDDERALVRLNQKLAAHVSLIPAGASPPVVQPRAIDDVPVMALTLWGPQYDDEQLRQFAAQLHDTLKELPDISEITIIGGRARRVTIDLDPSALASRHLDPLAVRQALARVNVRTTASGIVSRAYETWRSAKTAAERDSQSIGEVMPSILLRDKYRRPLTEVYFPWRRLQVLALDSGGLGAPAIDSSDDRHVGSPIAVRCVSTIAF